MYTTMAFVMPGPMELFVIFMIVLLLFGAKRIPEIACSCRKALNELKKGKNEPENEEDKRNHD